MAANFAGNQWQALREWKLLKVTKGAGAVKPAMGGMTVDARAAQETSQEWDLLV
jgi:hypothetical protein